jgi:hypothetical protein
MGKDKGVTIMVSSHGFNFRQTGNNANINTTLACITTWLNIKHRAQFTTKAYKLAPI